MELMWGFVLLFFFFVCLFLPIVLVQATMVYNLLLQICSSRPLSDKEKVSLHLKQAHAAFGKISLH